jgi:hypothetical protein
MGADRSRPDPLTFTLSDRNAWDPRKQFEASETQVGSEVVTSTARVDPKKANPFVEPNRCLSILVGPRLLVGHPSWWPRWFHLELPLLAWAKGELAGLPAKIVGVIDIGHQPVRSPSRGLRTEIHDGCDFTRACQPELPHQNSAGTVPGLLPHPG